MPLNAQDYRNLELLATDYLTTHATADRHDVRRQIEFLYVAWVTNGRRTRSGLDGLLMCIPLDRQYLRQSWDFFVEFRS